MTENNQSLIIQLKDVKKEYATGDGPFIALNNITLDISYGEFLGIIGKSGAGKTTLLNMISGVSEINAGEVLFYERENGHRTSNSSAIPIHSMDEDELALWRGQNLGIVYQSFELIPSLNLIENVMLPPDFSGIYHPRISKERALYLLGLVDIAEHAYKIPAHISGGQSQRVAIARALVNDPPLIVADEPTGNLDTVTAETIFQIFETLIEQGKTIVMVTHDESLAPRFSRQVQISDGEIVTPSKNGSPKSKRLASLDLDQSSDNLLSSLPTAKKSTNLIEFPSNGNVTGPAAENTDLSPDYPAIKLNAVNKTYENAAGKFTALKSIDLQLNYGQFISIVGKSGCGKSTLLNMITGIDHPTSGEVIVGNEDILKMNESQRALWRGRNLGVVFQFFQLLPTLTLLENTILPMDYCNVYRFNERPERAMELLRTVGLEQHAHKMPASVSSGQQQSAAIARALATNPSIILADEPTGNLDSRSAAIILDLFDELVAQGKTIMIVTHDPAITQRTDQTVILSDGEIVDQFVARALPLLSHPQMLAATHQAKTIEYSPGSIIIRQGEPVDHFFMVKEGDVEIILSSSRCEEMILARLGPGQFFGEVELTQGGNSIASVRAAHNGKVELALLPKDEFHKLVNESLPTQRALREVAQSRLAENRNQMERSC